MDKEDIFARKVIKALDEGLDDMDANIASRLSQARAKALQASPSSQSVILSSTRPGALTLAGLGGGPLSVKMAAGAIALLILFTGWSAHWNWVNTSAEETADLDAQILADDAPLQAYSDPLFSMTIRQGLLKSHSTQ